MIELNKKYQLVKDKLSKWNIKWNEVVRSGIYIICLGFLFYQFSSSCVDYYSYPTVVQIRIGNDQKQTLPAISVCRQMKATEYLEMVKKADEGFRLKFDNIKSTTDESKTDLNKTEEEVEKNQLDALAKLAHYFEMDGRNAISFWRIINNGLNVTCWDVRTNTTKPCDWSAFAIESFTHRRICYTYFSQLYDNYNFSRDKLNISENATANEADKEGHKESLIAWLQIDNPANDVYVYIHTSKSMPDINLYDLEMSRSRLFKNKTYGAIVSKFTVRRMEYPYATQCQNYITGRSAESDALSEFGCINNCKRMYWTKHPNYQCVPLDLNFIMNTFNDSSWFLDKSLRICNCTVLPCDKTLQACVKCPEADTDRYKRFAKKCENNCREDCYEEFYQKEMFELVDDFRDVIWQKYEVTQQTPKDNQSMVFLAYKNQEEVSYTHVPKMSQFDFFAAMGGLFSLWIGASILTIYDVLRLGVLFVIHAKKHVDKGRMKLGEKFANKQVKVRYNDSMRTEIYSQSPRLRRTPTYGIRLM